MKARIFGDSCGKSGAISRAPSSNISNRRSAAGPPRSRYVASDKTASHVSIGFGSSLKRAKDHACHGSLASRKPTNGPGSKMTFGAAIARQGLYAFAGANAPREVANVVGHGADGGFHAFENRRGTFPVLHDDFTTVGGRPAMTGEVAGKFAQSGRHVGQPRPTTTAPVGKPTSGVKLPCGGRPRGRGQCVSFAAGATLPEGGSETAPSFIPHTARRGRGS